MECIVCVIKPHGADDENINVATRRFTAFGHRAVHPRVVDGLDNRLNGGPENVANAEGFLDDGHQFGVDGAVGIGLVVVLVANRGLPNDARGCQGIELLEQGANAQPGEADEFALVEAPLGV